MSRKAPDPIKREERARIYRDMVAPYLGGEFVEAVGAFERNFDWGDWRHSQFGRIIAIFTRESDERKRQEREGRLSDLPEHFLLAVTRDRVHAFNLGSGHSKEATGRVADFPREDVSFATSENWNPVPVIELAEEGRKGRVEVKSNVRDPTKNPWAAEVVAALSE